MRRACLRCKRSALNRGIETAYGVQMGGGGLNKSTYLGLMHPVLSMQRACLRRTHSALNRETGPAYGVQTGGRAGLPGLMHPGLIRRTCLRCTQSALNKRKGPAYGVQMGGGLAYLGLCTQDLVCEGRAYGVRIRR